MIFRPGDLVTWLSSSAPMAYRDREAAAVREQMSSNTLSELSSVDNALLLIDCYLRLERSDAYVVLATDDLVMTALRNVDGSTIYIPLSWTNSLLRV